MCKNQHHLSRFLPYRFLVFPPETGAAEVLHALGSLEFCQECLAFDCEMFAPLAS